MDEQKLNEFLNGMGALAEIALIFHRNLLNSGATVQEATAITQSLIGAFLGNGEKKDG